VALTNSKCVFVKKKKKIKMFVFDSKLYVEVMEISWHVIMRP